MYQTTGQLHVVSLLFDLSGILPHYEPSCHGDRRLAAVTVKHLLQHSGGWDRETAGDPCFWKHIGKEMGVPEPVSQDTLVQYMMGQKLQFKPGV